MYNSPGVSRKQSFLIVTQHFWLLIIFLISEPRVEEYDTDVPVRPECVEVPESQHID